MPPRSGVVCAFAFFLGQGPIWSQAPDGEAEARALYKKLEESFRSAKTLHLRSTAHFRTTDFEADVAASLWIKEGNRMRLEIEIRGTKDHKPYAHRTRILSDGTRVRTRDDEEAWAEYATSPRWNEIVLADVLRGGFPTGLELIRITSKRGGPGSDVGIGFLPVPEPTRFARWKPEDLNGRSTNPIEFQLSSTSEFMRDCSVLLWLDARTGLPRRRMNVILTDRTLNVTESYEVVELNGTIDDSRFVPAKD